MNLSDVFEYMSPEDSDFTFTSLCDKIIPGGYLAYWNLFTNRYPPANNSRTLTDISHELRKIDRGFFFKFCLFKVI